MAPLKLADSFYQAIVRAPLPFRGTHPSYSRPLVRHNVPNSLCLHRGYGSLLPVAQSERHLGIFSQMSIRTMVRSIVYVLLAIAFAGCGGNTGCTGSGDDAPLGAWIVLTVQPTLNVNAGGLGTVDVRVQNNSNVTGYQITVGLEGTAPLGWTVTGSSKFLESGSNKIVTIPVEFRVPANWPNGQRIVELRVSDDDNTNNSDQIVRVFVNVGSAAGTAIYETSAFVPNLDGRFESGLEITNGEVSPLSTLVEARPLNFVFETDALVWFSPKAGGFVVDPGGTRTMKCTALPRTNTVAKTFQIENYFLNPWQGGREEKYASQFAAKEATDVQYTINSLDWYMGVLMTDPDKTTEYNVTFDPVPTGKAGLYTFSVANLDTTQYSATLNPPNAPVNANSDPVTVTVTITRIGGGTGETVDEFTLQAQHDVHADITGLLRLPIRTYVGR